MLQSSTLVSMVAAVATGPMDWEGEEEKNAPSVRIQVQVQSPLARGLGCVGCPKGRSLPWPAAARTFQGPFLSCPVKRACKTAVKWRV